MFYNSGDGIEKNWYLFLEFLGAFITAALVFGIYYDAINQFDAGCEDK